ncbi:hypothetical protein FK220_003140 [Flavobacteriaceae bacterium TP-CH-4]|uniref:tRNA_anti-like n=1 Tax=Pelagihabitans pacificus TaxID=2696054 RepID=A0A967E9B8_9FLAO|nr:hypothetical protein [Pelagihabitans pacificus]NHF58321.1 hypothetical protein [Pelagihabitans pacificus]
MSKKNKRYFLMGFAALVILTAFVIYDRVFNAAPREIAKETTEFSIPADNLQFHFADNQAKATAKYLNRVLETSGSVTELGTNTMVLENRVQVYFLDNPEQDISLGDTISIKGRCVGFDELLLLVKIDQATTIKQNK